MVSFFFSSKYYSRGRGLERKDGSQTLKVHSSSSCTACPVACSGRPPTDLDFCVRSQPAARILSSGVSKRVCCRLAAPLGGGGGGVRWVAGSPARRPCVLQQEDRWQPLEAVSGGGRAASPPGPSCAVVGSPSFHSSRRPSPSPDPLKALDSVVRALNLWFLSC